MPDKPLIIAMIPARIGSTRLKMKNLALLNGKPIIAYAIEAAKKSRVFDRIVLNSDSDIFLKIADRYNVEYYHRPEHLGSHTTKSDDVVLDFIQHHLTEIVVWVNPISPLQTGDEIKEIIQYFIQKKLDSLVTVKDEQVHCIYKNEAVNFTLEGKFSQTQDLTPIQSFVYSIMMWRTHPFVEAMKEKGSAFFTGKIGFYPVGKLASMIIKTAEDLQLIDFILKAGAKETESVQYDELVKGKMR